MAFEDAAFCIVDFFAAILLAATGTPLLTTAFGRAFPSCSSCSAQRHVCRNGEVPCFLKKLGILPRRIFPEHLPVVLLDTPIRIQRVIAGAKADSDPRFGKIGFGWSQHLLV
ncbi:hypothetical protein ACXIVK_19020 [Paraburkholderia caledonica]